MSTVTSTVTDHLFCIADFASKYLPQSSHPLRRSPFFLSSTKLQKNRSWDVSATSFKGSNARFRP
ncbi:hypothetical protein AKJ16_DCAP20273 [Drosera capensis]